MVDNRVLQTRSLPEHAMSVEANTQILREMYIHSHCEVKRVWDNVMVQKHTGFQLGKRWNNCCCYYKMHVHS